VRPPITGLDHPAVRALRTVPDVDALRASVDELLSNRQNGTRPQAVVVGAGFIGLEAVEALTTRGLEVHLVELADTSCADRRRAGPAARRRARQARRRSPSGVSAQSVAPNDAASAGAVTVTLSDGATLAADLVIVNVGVRPASGLARDAGLDLGPTGAIRVDDDQRTSDPHIWAVGDAVEVTHAITGTTGPVPLAGPPTARAGAQPTPSAGIAPRAGPRPGHAIVRCST